MKAILISALAGVAAAETFIVKLKNDADDGAIADLPNRFPQVQVAKSLNIGDEFRALEVEADDVSELEKDELVEYIEPNVEFELFLPVSQDEEEEPAPTEEKVVGSWGQDRINQRDLPLDDQYTPFGGAGSGATVYVLDTGIEDSHPEFQGRARFGFNGAGGTNADRVGHGTHVAGTVAARTYGVAPRAEVVSVKVCASNSCALNAILSGVEWAARDARGKRAVGNMSLGGPTNRAIDDAVSSAISSGFPIVAASGNSNADACRFSPARVPGAITVNASTIRDGKASFSNRGTCTDLYAPGEGIASTWINGGTRTISGTSMAAPHVAGIAAVFLGERSYTPSQLSSAIVNAASNGKISNPGSGSPNKLLYFRP